MVIATTDSTILQRVVGLMPALSERAPGLALVYLFGSTAKGQRHPGSDIDLALLVATPLGQLERFDLAAWLADELRADVDLIDLGSASTVMQKEVVADATLVHGSEPARVAFEGRVLSAYARLNEERRPILERIAREGRVPVIDDVVLNKAASIERAVARAREEYAGDPLGAEAHGRIPQHRRARLSAPRHRRRGGDRPA